MRRSIAVAVREMRRIVDRPVREVRLRAPVGPKWHVAPPDFVGVGVQRAGTSWWHELLDAHPDVHDRGKFTKEVHFFDRLWQEDIGPAGVDAYHRHFARPVGKKCGEWTPRYMFDPWTPSLLRRAAPEAKLLVLLRDPVARLRSAVTHATERGRQVDETVLTAGIARGFYHRQLTHLLRFFPREQVLVLQLERCTRDPKAALDQTLRFLDLRTDVDLSHALDARVNTRRGDPAALSRVLIDEVTKLYEPDVSALANEFAEIDLSLWPSFGSLTVTS